MINPRIARYMLTKHGRGGLPGLVHDNLADLGITPRPLDGEEDEGPQDTAINEAAQGLDVPQQAALPGAEPEELEDYPQPFTAPPTVEAQAPVVASRATAEDDDEAGARRMDANTALARGFETAGRQFLAGMTRTPVLDTLTEQSNAVGQARTAAKTRAEQLRAAAEEARRSRLDSSTLEDNEASRIEKLARAAALSRDMRRGLDPDLENRRLDLKEQEIRGDDARGNRLLDIKEKAAGRVPVAKAPKVERGIPAGWEADPSAPPSEGNKTKFTALVFADNKMRGLTSQMRKLLSTAGARGTYLPGENAAVKQLATQIKIEGKNIAELGALSGPDLGLMEAIAGDPTTLFSAVKDTDALLSGLDAWGGNSVSAGQKAYGVRPKGGAGGKVTMSNGRETLNVDPADVAEAAKEGFKRVAP